MSRVEIPQTQLAGSLLVSSYGFSRWRRENFLLKSSNEVKKPAPQAKNLLQNACF